MSLLFLRASAQQSWSVRSEHVPVRWQQSIESSAISVGYWCSTTSKWSEICTPAYWWRTYEAELQVCSGRFDQTVHKQPIWGQYGRQQKAFCTPKTSDCDY